MSTKAQILVQLLDIVPNADTLQRLLEPENLLYLLQHYGHKKEALQQRLSNGTLPEELLLELLQKESSVVQLLVHLHDNMDTTVVKKVDIFPAKPIRTTPLVSVPVVIEKDAQTPPVEPATSQPVAPLVSTRTVNSPSPRRKHELYTPTVEQDERMRGRALESIAMLIILLTSILPGATWKSFSLNIVLCVIIASMGGAAAGALYAHYKGLPRWRSILIGIVLDVSILLSLMTYLEVRPSISKLELLLPVGLGCLPALALYYILNRKK